MEHFTTTPHLHGLPTRGYLNGVTILSSDDTPLCHRFGAVPYTIPLNGTQRWKRAPPLPPAYNYGTKTDPLDCTNLSAECPQDSRFGANRMVEGRLECNVWIPLGEPPKGGWPVFVYIHGGYLQWGSPNRENPASLLSSTSVRAIIVAPTYRLSVFGFLASAELRDESPSGAVGNLGFWDQRLAIEWTHATIAGFGGNPANITVGGLSAGAHSTFHQLSYELGLPDDFAVIRRVVMWSNGAGLQPKPVAEVQPHFDALCAALKIDPQLEPALRLRRLRSFSSADLVAAAGTLPENSFRSVTDGVFVRHTLFAELADGRFARVMRRRGMKILMGDLSDEWTTYRNNSPPTSYHGLVQRLSVEFRESAAGLLAKIYCPDGAPPRGIGWKELFGHCYADMQVHVTQRGLASSLAKGGLPLGSILRYRINYRAACNDDASYPPKMGVTHASDLVVWFAGNGRVVGEGEKALVGKFLEPFGRYLRGEEEVGFGTGGVEEVRAIMPDMSIRVVRDGEWERGLRVWKALQGVGGRESRL